MIQHKNARTGWPVKTV